ncbi:MAG: TonB-dependent receptor [Gammaproteobacteria bacterium]|nr:TonB-dependent receptor [Gammaproteobacteria bacterium]
MNPRRYQSFTPPGIGSEATSYSSRLLSMLHRTLTCACLTLCALATSTINAYADTGDLLVTVTSVENRPLTGSTITIESRAGDEQKAVADSSGRAMIRNLQVGLYRVTTELQGFVRVVEPSVRVVRGKIVPVEMVLRRSRYEAIEEIVVVAEAIRRDAYGSVASTYVDREHLRTATGGGGDVLRALDGLPGLVSGGEFSNFTVRGRGPRDNLILVDDFPFDKVVHFDDSLGEQDDISGGGRYSIFAPNLIEGAEFSPGGWSAAYGGRNGSLLKLDVAKGNPSPSASLRLDLAGTELVYDGPSGLHDETSLIATARRFDFGRFFETIGEEDIGSPVMTDLILKTHTRINPANEFEFLLLYTPEDSERTVANVLHSVDLEDRELLNTEQDSALVGVTWTRLFGKDGTWENRAYFRDSEKTSREGEAFPFSEPVLLPEDQVPTREDILTLKEAETEIGFRSDLSLGNRWGLFGAGVRMADLDLEFETVLDGDWIRYEYDAGDHRPAPMARCSVLTPPLTTSAFVRSEFQYAAYAEQVFEAPRWDIRVGARYEHDGFSAGGRVSPRLSANFGISPTTRFSATAGTFYQSPRFLDRARAPENAGLRNTRLDHVSLGLGREFGRWNVLVEAYYQRLNDLITDSDAVTGVATNAGEGTAYGVDVVLNRPFHNGWSANAVYSYNDAKRNDNDGDGKYAPDYNHRHIFGLGARWEINERWQVGFRWKYATGRPRDAYLLHSDVLASLGGPLRYSQEFINNNSLSWDDFHTLHLRVDYRRPVGPVDLVAFLDILNIYASPPSDVLEFNPATGSVVPDDGEPFPLIGIRFEKTW